MSTYVSSCAVAPPPLTGGGIAPPVQSPIQAPVEAGGASGAPAQSPMQVPLQGSAAQEATAGGALAQPGPAPAPAPAASPAPVPAPTVAGGGPADLQQVLPALQQVVATLTSLVASLQAQVPAAQAEAGAAGVQGGGGTAVGGDAGDGGPIGTAPVGGAGCGCGSTVAQHAGEAVAAAYRQAEPKRPNDAEGAGAAAGGNGKLDSAALTVKGRKLDPEQRKNIEIVLQVGKEMGASRKVLEASVSTMIQESGARNDASVDSKDRDSLGLFQQRPSQGWGTRAQISDPRYAARKFFEKAIPADQKNPGQAKTALAQSVQRSAFPDAYAKWDGEAEKIVADFME